MNKLRTTLIALLMVTAVLSTANNMNHLQAVPSGTVGVDEFTKYTWTLDTVNLQTTFIVKNDENSMMFLGNNTDDLLNQLQGAKISLSIGKIYNSQGELYLVPIVILQNDIQVTSEMLMDMGLDANAANQLAFTIPRGSGIVLLGAITDFGTTTPSLLTTSVESIKNPSALEKIGTIGPNIIRTLMSRGPNPDDLLVGSLRYRFATAQPPAPIVVPSMLDSFGAQWESNSGGGITNEYSKSGDDAIFTASGTTEINTTNPGQYMYKKLEINNFEMIYSVEMGLLKRIAVNMHYVMNDTWYSEFEGVWKTHYVDITINLELNYRGASDVEIGLTNGEKLGYKVTDLYMSDGLINAINATLNGTLTAENVTFVEQFFEAMKVTFEYQSYNPVYDSGLDLYYNTEFENELVNESDTGNAMFNIYQLGAPYITPDWEVQFATFQFQQYIYLKLYPKFTKFMIENESANHYFNYNSDYSIYESPDGNWISLISNLTINIGVHHTNTTNDEVKMDASLTINSWMTYSSDGRLTEVGVIVQFSFKNDTNLNDDLGDETEYSGTARILIQRVQNTGGPTGTPNFNEPIDAPEPTSDWQETTPEETTSGGTSGGGATGGIPSTIGGIPTTYIGGGVALIVIVAAIIFALRRR